MSRLDAIHNTGYLYPNMTTTTPAAETTTTKTLSEWIADLRKIRDGKDQINAALSDLNKLERETEIGLLAAMEAAGLGKPGDKASSADGTAIRQQKWRAKYDPAKWPDFFKWCAEHDRSDLIQRRTSDAKLMEIQDQGQPFPPGVEMEPYTDLLFRRS